MIGKLWWVEKIDETQAGWLVFLEEWPTSQERREVAANVVSGFPKLVLGPQRTLSDSRMNGELYLTGCCSCGHSQRYEGKEPGRASSSLWEETAGEAAFCSECAP